METQGNSTTSNKLMDLVHYYKTVEKVGSWAKISKLLKKDGFVSSQTGKAYSPRGLSSRYSVWKRSTPSMEALVEETRLRETQEAVNYVKNRLNTLTVTLINNLYQEDFEEAQETILDLLEDIRFMNSPSHRP